MTKLGFISFYAIITYAFFIIWLVVFSKDHDFSRFVNVGELIAVVGTYCWASMSMIVDKFKTLEVKMRDQEKKIEQLAMIEKRVCELESELKAVTRNENLVT